MVSIQGGSALEEIVRVMNMSARNEKTLYDIGTELRRAKLESDDTVLKLANIEILALWSLSHIDKNGRDVLTLQSSEAPLRSFQSTNHSFLWCEYDYRKVVIH